MTWFRYMPIGSGVLTIIYNSGESKRKEEKRRGDGGRGGRRRMNE